MSGGFLKGDLNVAKRADVREKIRQSKLKNATRPCGNCQKIIPTTPYELRERKNQFCSLKCMIEWRKTRRGSNGAHWMGGKIIDKSGYVLILKPNHPFADKKGYVQEHRLVMEKSIGRYLQKEEIIHHLDYSKDNNNIENLVITTRKEHLVKYHYESLIKRLEPRER